MGGRRLVLAYSGGLDTMIILHWLAARGYEVIAYTADLGQQEDFERLRAQALAAGASRVVVDDVRDELVRDFLFPVLRANAIYQDRYLLGTPIARPLTARRQVEVALELDATHLAHGATGKGNDQLRFELVYRAHGPQLEVVAPWRDPQFLGRFGGRPAALAYAAEHGLPVASTAAASWSIDENLVHTSYEGGDLERLDTRAQERMFLRTCAPLEAPDEETLLELTFRNGDLVHARNVSEGIEADTPRTAFALVDRAAAANAIGRVDYVESRAVGLKSRNVYEAPGATVLHLAHRDLEHLTMDHEVMRLRDSLIPEFATLVYRGLWYAPELQVLRALVDAAQRHVTGVVRVALYKGNVVVVGRSSDHGLYDPGRSSMDAIGAYEPGDADGYIQLSALRLAAHSERERRNLEP
jgi:argininosuccinate synthase